jgi:hypothetical protein
MSTTQPIVLRRYDAISRTSITTWLRERILDFIHWIACFTSDVEIAEPMRGRDMDPQALSELLTFRRERYASIAPYLNGAYQRSVEERLDSDQDGFHLIAKKQGRIVGTLRLNDTPFEIAAHNPGFERICAELGPGYIEMSRVLTDQQTKGAGKKLLIMAGLWVTRRTRFIGILGHCKAEKLSYFAKLGLRADRERSYSIPGRGDTRYFLIHADFTQMIRAVLKNFARKIVGL